MLTPPYNPFQKRIDDVSVDDLGVLRTVPEGLYVEYKRELTDPKSIAKSVAGFANSYGGWLIFGIAEANDTTAGTFIGIPTIDAPAAAVKIRQAISSHMSLPAYFEIKIISGQSAELGLAESRAIIFLEILPSRNTPHVHSDGRIYRRFNNETRAETDRYLLDQLWQRSEGHQKELTAFFEHELEASKSEDEASYVEIFIVPSYWKVRTPRRAIPFKEFAQLMQQGLPNVGGLPFHNIFSSSDSLIARQTSGNNFERITFTWRWFYDGRSHITVPLSSCKLSDYETANNFFKTYRYSEEFLQLCKATKISWGPAIDLNTIFALFWGITLLHKKLSESAGIEFPFNLKLRTRGFWRCIPFLDLLAFKNFCTTYGLPIVQQDEAFWPPENFLCVLPGPEDGTDESGWIAGNSTKMFAGLCQMLGFPLEGMATNEEWATEITQLIGRAMEAQAHRNQGT